MWAVDGACDEPVIRWHVILLFPQDRFFFYVVIFFFTVCFEEIQISIKKWVGQDTPKRKV